LQQGASEKAGNSQAEAEREARKKQRKHEREAEKAATRARAEEERRRHAELELLLMDEHVLQVQAARGEAHACIAANLHAHALYLNRVQQVPGHRRVWCVHAILKISSSSVIINAGMKRGTGAVYYDIH
jgi:hypothetical protein